MKPHTITFKLLSSEALEEGLLDPRQSTDDLILDLLMTISEIALEMETLCKVERFLVELKVPLNILISQAGSHSEASESKRNTIARGVRELLKIYAKVISDLKEDPDTCRSIRWGINEIYERLKEIDEMDLHASKSSLRMA